jgi:hypothetical protein
MRTATKLLAIGLAIGVVVVVARTRRQRRAGADQPTNDFQPAPLADASPGDEVVIPPGIAQVDPAPLTQIAGEGIEPESTQAAHEEIPERRERLPVHGKNLI